MPAGVHDNEELVADDVEVPKLKDVLLVAEPMGEIEPEVVNEADTGTTARFSEDGV